MGEKSWKGHLSMLVACIIWGLMSPIGKDAMINGISGFAMVIFRVTGATLFFWITSLFMPNEHVKTRDMVLFFFASLLSIVFNQCSFTIGLSLTSPINASIVTTTSPIITMIVAAIYLKEPVTGKKVMGIFLGALGALILILGSATAGHMDSSLEGDLLCFLAQFSFSCYLSIFKNLISKYNVITSMKWMFMYASICLVPFSYNELNSLNWNAIPVRVWLDTSFVVFGGTYIAYILMMMAQKILRPTIISMYNYVQPIVATVVSVAVGLGTFGWTKGIAVILVFYGVWLVTQSKSRVQMEKEKQNLSPSKNKRLQK